MKLTKELIPIIYLVTAILHLLIFLTGRNLSFDIYLIFPPMVMIPVAVIEYFLTFKF